MQKARGKRNTLKKQWVRVRCVWRETQHCQVPVHISFAMVSPPPPTSLQCQQLQYQSTMGRRYVPQDFGAAAQLHPLHCAHQTRQTLPGSVQGEMKEPSPSSAPLQPISSYSTASARALPSSTHSTPSLQDLNSASRPHCLPNDGSKPICLVVLKQSTSQPLTILSRLYTLKPYVVRFRGLPPTELLSRGASRHTEMRPKERTCMNLPGDIRRLMQLLQLCSLQMSAELLY